MKVILTFLICDMKMFEIEVNTKTQTNKVLFVSSHKLALDAILIKQDQNYFGVQRRLQYWLDDKRPLEDLIKRIQKEGFFYSGQINLRIKVKKN